VNLAEQKGKRSIRQLGFQETDIVSMAQPITKAAWAIRDVAEVPDRLRQAFILARSGRPGPVLLDVPMDVQRAEIPRTRFPDSGRDPSPPSSVGSEGWRRVEQKVATARRPLLLVGGGVRSGRCVGEFRRLAETLGIPVVHSLMGVDALPGNHPLRIGMIGTYGNRWANLALGRADFLLVLGSRLDVRQTGSRTDAFKQGRAIIHVDCERGEINNRVQGCLPIVSDLRDFLQAAPLAALKRRGHTYADWHAEISRLRACWPDDQEHSGITGINPNRFMRELSRTSRHAMAFVADVGQHQMWAAQSLELTSEQRFLTSGGMGAMGFALPAAIGASYALEGAPVVVIAGDGGFQCNVQELQTIVRNQLAIKMAVVNNRCHGMVRQFQESYFHSRFPATWWGYSVPNFVKIARAYGLKGRVVAQESELGGALAWWWRNPAEPCLLEVMIDTRANAYPKVAFGEPITVMEPRGDRSRQSSPSGIPASLADSFIPGRNV
jgi:acetolactate synthase-1/2/3 large subunit